MPLKLKVTSGVWPPGGHPFQDPKTHKKFDGMSADLDLQTWNVIKHRKANPSLYDPSTLSYDDVRQEIVNYICSLKPELCVEGDMKRQPAITTAIQPPVGKKCFKCNGTEFDPAYCPTCSGQRLRGWKCRKCGTENPK